MKIKKILSAPFKMIGKNIFPLLIVGGLGFYLFSADQGFRPHVMKEMNYYGDTRLSSQSVSYDMADVAEESMGAPMMAKSSRGISPVPPIYADDGFAPDETDRKVIKNASLNMEVENTDEAKTLAEAEVKSLGGFITNMNSHEVRLGVLAYNMTVRVPAEKLDIAMVNLSKLGAKKSENFSSSDITAQYADTEAQIKNLETRRERLRTLMEFETESLNDVLQVDRELNNVQNQLDRLTRTQKGRDEKVAYSTLSLSLNPETQIGDITNPEWNPEKSWKTSVNELIQKSQSIIDKLIRLVVLSPIWVPVLLILWLIKRKFWKK